MQARQGAAINNMMIELCQNEDLDRLLETSQTNPVLIFKHSTQCSVSGVAYEELQRFTETFGDVPCGVILVIENRALSNSAASRLNVRHQSPQAILVERGLPVWTASQWSITTDALEKALSQFPKCPTA